jgi:ribosomal protein S12 methylthiotransferase accessory factor YcaO
MSKSFSTTPLRLRSTKKYSTGGDHISTRVRSVEDTLTMIMPLCKKIGVTRISDITNMDRLYIPNYVSILPGTEDTIWVYGGKGPTKAHAKASALMESIERYCSLASTSSKNLIQGTYTQLSKQYDKVLHPDEVVEPAKRTYNDKESIMDFLSGFDLLKKVEVLVPAELVFSRYSAKPPSVNAFLSSHTNGLASGNVLEEAICHALCEVIERDAASIAHLCASSIPYSILERIMNTLSRVTNNKSEFNQIAGSEFVDDSSIFPDVNLSQIANEFKPLKFLVDRFTDAGISLLIKDITQKDIGIPTFVASSIEWITSDYGYFAIGYGTHLDSKVALIRAITELSQTRAGDIQGSRDDLKKIRYKENDEIYKRKWQFMPATSSSSKKDNNTIMFSEIKTYAMDDIRDDIEFILSRLKKSGLKRAIIVDLTDPNIGIPVVRAIVPGLETFEIARLFTSSEIFMGRRAKNHFQTLLRS